MGGSTPILRAYLRQQGCNRESICRENYDSINPSICEALWSCISGNQSGCNSMLRKSFLADRNSGNGTKPPGNYSERSGPAKPRRYACVQCATCEYYRWQFHSILFLKKSLNPLDFCTEAKRCHP